MKPADNHYNSPSLCLRTITIRERDKKKNFTETQRNLETTNKTQQITVHTRSAFTKNNVESSGCRPHEMNSDLSAVSVGLLAFFSPSLLSTVNSKLNPLIKRANEDPATSGYSIRD